MAGRGGKREGAGRPVAPHTVQAEAAKAELIRMFVAAKKPIFEALLQEAKNGNIPALRELFERVWGKEVANVDLTSKGQALPGAINIITPDE